MLRFLVHLSLLLNPLVAANVRLTPVPSQGIGYHTRTITKSVVHTSVIRRAGFQPASRPLNYEDLSKRSDDLHSLHIPFQDEEGYISLYLSNSTALPFCKGVGATLYEDSAKVFLALNVKTLNTTTIVPVREDQAIEFCQGIKKGEGLENGAPTSKASGRPSKTAEISGGSATPAESEVDETTKEASVKPTKAADMLTMPNATSATPTQDDAEPSQSSPADTTSTKTAKPTKSLQASAKPTASLDAEKDTTTTEVVYITSSANLKEKPTRATSKATANQGEETDTTTTEVVYITPTADSTSEGMPETSFANGSEVGGTPTSKPGSEDGDSTTSSPDETASVGNGAVGASTTESPVKKNKPEDIPTIKFSPLVTSAPKSTPKTRDAEVPDQTENQTDAKVAEIGHQKTRLITSVTGGAAVQPRTWESKGKRRVEILGSGLWRKRRVSKEVSNRSEEAKEKEPERVPAPQRPASTPPSFDSEDDEPTSSPTLTRVPLPSSAKHADIDFRETSSTTKPTKSQTTHASIQDIDTMSFSFPTSTSLSNPQHQSPPRPSPNPKPHIPPSSPSKENTPLLPSHEHELSSAFGAIHDPRMIWTVRFMWVIAGLQIVCGVWEFVKNVTGGRGRWRVDLVGRWGNWDRRGAVG